MTIEAEEAKKLSKIQIKALENDDPLFESLENTTVGDPVMVKNVFRQPSYWLVPLLKEGIVAGFVRILLNGKVLHLGTFHRRSGKLEHRPTFITGVESSEAYKLAAKEIRKDIGESASEPVFVHDGPIGREAWLVEVSKDGKANRWIFVAGQGVYERRAGESLDSTDI